MAFDRGAYGDTCGGFYGYLKGGIVHNAIDYGIADIVTNVEIPIVAHGEIKKS